MSRKSIRKTGVFIVTTMGAVMASVTADAQQTTELQTVVVTAQRRAQAANEVGMSITALDGDLLKQQGIVSVGDLANITPGMTYTESAFGLPIYTLRGMGNDDNQSAQQSPTVGIYTDQVVLPYAVLSRGPQWDLERVEVLKGPQGTLFGISTTGGAINYIAKKPTKQFESGVSVGLGSSNAWNTDAYLSGPLSDNVRGRVSALTRNGGDWQRSMSRGEKTGGKDIAAFRGQLEIAPSKTIDFLLAFSHWADKSNITAAQPNGLSIQNPASPVATRLNDQMATTASDAEWTAAANRQASNPANSRGYGYDQSLDSLSGTLNWRLLDSVTLTSLTNTTKFKRDDMFSPVPLAVENNDVHETGEIRVFSQELRLTGKNDKFDWVAGVFFEKDKVTDLQVNYTKDQSSIEVMTNVVDINQFYTQTEQQSKTRSLFGQVEWKFTDSLKATFGLRRNNDKKDFNGCSGDTGDALSAATFLNIAINAPIFTKGQCTTFQLVGGIPKPGLVVNSLDENTTSGRVGLDWQVNKDVLTYFNITKGAKAGGFPTLAGNSAAQFSPVKAERVVGYEAGLKARLFDRRSQLNASVYHYDYDNKQIRGFAADPLFGTLARLINVEKSIVQGAEFDFRWRATQALTLNAQASYTRTEVREHVGLDFTGKSTNFAGQSFPLTPVRQASIGGDYRFPLSGDLSGFVGLDVRYTGDSKGNTTFILTNPAWHVPSRTLVDLRFGLAPDIAHWQVYGSIKNLTDKYYWVDARQLNDVNGRYAGRPQTYSLTFSYDF